MTARGRIDVVGGGAATPEEVAAIVAALDGLSAPTVSAPAPPSPWRWSGRRWEHDARWQERERR